MRLTISRNGWATSQASGVTRTAPDLPAPWPEILRDPAAISVGAPTSAAQHALVSCLRNAAARGG